MGRASERIGLFGGSFDPPHAGHVSAARDVADALGLDRVLWMPAARSPFKNEEGTTPRAVRFALVEAAAGADPRFRARDDELRGGGVSYTVDTLRSLHAARPSASWYLLIGVDQALEFERWREPAAILELARLAVMDRDGVEARGLVGRLPGGEDRVVAVPVRRVDLSSSDVRIRVAEGLDVSGMVPPEVLAIVRRERLYVEGGAR